MISAHDAEIIGAMTDGGVIHADCIPKGIRFTAMARVKVKGLSDRYYWWELEEDGYTALSRYSIGEWESSNWGDLEYHLESGPINEDDIDYTNETVEVDGETVDVSTYVGVFCDDCNERIW